MLGRLAAGITVPNPADVGYARGGGWHVGGAGRGTLHVRRLALANPHSAHAIDST